MSSSYRRASGAGRWLVLGGATAVCAALQTSPALAAETYVQPQLDLRAEVNDNWDLEPNASSSSAEAYYAEAQALFGIATQRSDTSIRPRLSYSNVPDEDRDWVNAYLDFRTQYSTQRGEFFVLARYSYEDLYDVRIADAAYDDFEPDDPDIPDTARVVDQGVNQRFNVAPSYTYSWSERTRIGTGAYYQQSRYDTDQQQDYNYVRGEAFVRWMVSPNSDVSVTPYASYFEVQEDDGSKTTAYGLSVGYQYRWSEISGVDVFLTFEDNDVTTYSPEKDSESTSGVGGSVTAYRKGEVSQWRFTAESGWYPTGDGGIQETGQVRLQYLRDITQRLTFDGAVRALSTRAIGSEDDNDDRDFARLELSMRWMMSPTLYVAGGYNYTWQEYKVEDDSADNNQLFLSFGYLGLGRRPR